MMNIRRSSGYILTIIASTILSITLVGAAPKPKVNGKIAFTSDRDGNREIYVMNPDGTDQVRLTDNSVATIVPPGRLTAESLHS